MIDYEEELKKFEPCLDVTDAEGAIYDRELTDILDVLQEVLRRSFRNKPMHISGSFFFIISGNDIVFFLSPRNSVIV